MQWISSGGQEDVSANASNENHNDNQAIMLATIIGELINIMHFYSTSTAATKEAQSHHIKPKLLSTHDTTWG